MKRLTWLAALAWGHWVTTLHAGTAVLASAVPLPGVWWNPQEPGTALFWDYSWRHRGWFGIVLEYDQQGWPIWLELTGYPIRYRDITQAAEGRPYAQVRGQLDQINSSCLQMRCYEDAVVVRTGAGAVDIEFFDSRHARWTRGGKSVLIEHFGKHEHGGVPVQAGASYLLMPRGASTGQRANAALVRALPVTATTFALQCLDCSTDEPSDQTGTRRLRSADLQSLRLDCSSGECEVRTDGLPAQAWLQLSYANRTHALSRISGSALSEVLLFDFERPLEWRAHPAEPMATQWMPQPTDSGAFRIGNNDDQTRHYARLGSTIMVTQYDKSTVPRWYIKYPGSGLCGHPNLASHDCLVRARGYGAFGEPILTLENQASDLPHRFIGYMFGQTVSLLTRPYFPPWPPLDPQHFDYADAQRLGVARESSSGILVVRATDFELRARVRRHRLETGMFSSIESYECMDCSQTGIQGDATLAEQQMRNVLQRFRTVHSFSGGMDFHTRHVYEHPDGTEHHYAVGYPGRHSDEIRFVAHPNMGPRGTLLPLEDDSVPVTLQYFPLQD